MIKRALPTISHHTSPVDQASLPQSGELDKYLSMFNSLSGYEEFTLDLQGKIISSNLELMNITGYEEWEVIGRNFSMFYTEDQIEKNVPASDLENATLSGKVFGNTWMIKKKGIKFWAKTKLTRILGSVGEMNGFRFTIKDATHKALSNFKLKRVKDEYLNIFNNSFVGIFKISLEKPRSKFLNERASDIFGEFFSLADIFSQKADYQRFMETVLNNEQVSGFEFQVMSQEGKTRWVSIDCKLFGNDIIEGIVFDVTERRIQQETLQKISYDLNMFIYHASHDLRSPLTTILGLVNLIKLHRIPAIMRRYVEMIIERINHLDGLLRDLASVAFNNHQDLTIEKFNVAAEVKEVAKELIKGFHHVSIHISGEEDICMVADLIRFRTIIRNLLSNSVKYANRESPEPFVKVAVTIRNRECCIVVEDNGIGMSDQELFSIFNIFSKGEFSQGPGLGLYIVKSMVDKMSGRINVSSKIGRGSSFFLSFPENPQS